MSQPESNPEDPPPEVAAVLRRVQQAIETRRVKDAAKGTAPPPPEKPKQAEIVQLPLWNREAPAAPNAALRSALFPAIQSKDRRFINNEIVASVAGVEVKLKGEQLNQEDLDALLALENVAREHPDTLTCQISERGLLRMLGRRSGTTNEKALADSLLRLEQPITVKMGRFSYSGGFVHHIYKDDITKRYVVQLNPRLGALLRTGWTALDTGIRRQLTGKLLALWLQAFYATHDKPFAYSVEKLRELSGSRTAALKKFRQNLKTAVKDWAATGDIQGWTIDASDNLHITKPRQIRRKPRR
jgi:hypothetical protein